eukprot:CAMPEP_0115067320 /NCGR_PEP_ID=MMETSP0227-20121206/11322_1 /TAXON_ID=89957 /ORGANISM="Polarella glacialis, Strain CCMP 1383" /LENGTH=352 /DNA_ID=CAMNT_0002453369 /DNA_START=20 /DNA_END=1079 /DNA_ORIENTATION=-
MAGTRVPLIPATFGCAAAFVASPAQQNLRATSVAGHASSHASFSEARPGSSLGVAAAAVGVMAAGAGVLRRRRAGPVASTCCVVALHAESPRVAKFRNQDGVATRISYEDLFGTHCSSYQDLLRTAPADPDDNKTRLLGPMPSILCVLEEMTGDLHVTQVDHLRKGQLPDTLEFSGAESALLVPSLDATPLLKAAGAGSFDRVTVSVEVNSDAYNRGLGVMLEISPLVKGGAEKQQQQQQRQENYIKFHPGMLNGPLRVEGPGGWANQRMGFNPASWSGSGQKFHTLHFVLNANGENIVGIEGTNAGEESWWKWTNQLTDGQYLPAVSAWLDGGGDEPVVIGKITMRVHCTE